MADARGGDLLTIDALARRSGFTTRNIRAYQSRGLLPPPEVRGRTGYYGPEHMERLALIREMQADGFNLTAIKRLLEGAGGAWEDVVGFKRAALSGWDLEEPEMTTVREIVRRFGVADRPDLLERAVELGLLVHVGDDRYEVVSPSLVRAGERVVELGVPLETALEVIADVLEHSEAVAAAFTGMFLDCIIKPFAEAGAPAAEWPRVRQALEKMRPLAGQAVAAGFALRMTAAADEAFGRVLAGEDWPELADRVARDRSPRPPRPKRAPRAHASSGRRRGADD